MKLTGAPLAGALLLVASSSSSPTSTSAFAPVRLHPRFSSNSATFQGPEESSRSALLLSSDKEGSSSTTPCDTPSEEDVQAGAVDLVSQKGSAQLLRSAMLTNADGEKVQLGDSMGSSADDTSIVVFLRHLG